MIRAALEEEIPESAYHIYRVPDIHNSPQWVGHVEDIIGEFLTLYTTNPVNERLFKEAGYEIAFHERRKGVSGSAIRELIAAGDDTWLSMVPEAVAQIIRDSDGISKIQGLYKKNSE